LSFLGGRAHGQDHICGRQFLLFCFDTPLPSFQKESSCGGFQRYHPLAQVLGDPPQRVGDQASAQVSSGSISVSGIGGAAEN